MLLHPRTKEVKLISLSACARHESTEFPGAAQWDMNVVDGFFNREASQVTGTQESTQSQGGNQKDGECSSYGDEYFDDSDAN